MILLIITASGFLLDITPFTFLIARQGDNYFLTIPITSFLLLLLVEENCITRLEEMIVVIRILMLKIKNKITFLFHLIFNNTTYTDKGIPVALSKALAAHTAAQSLAAPRHFETFF